MSDLTLLAPQSSYFALLNTQSSNGLTSVLQAIQDGLGRNTPLSLSQIALDINTTMGSGFSIDGTLLTATASQINAVCQYASFAGFTAALKLPAGTTSQRPSMPTNGDIRYNATTQSGELYAADAWMTLNAGNPSGYYPGGPTYIQDTYADFTFNVCMGTPAQIVTNRTECSLFGDLVVQTDSSGSHLSAFGYQALMSDSSGPDNSAFGHMSGAATISGGGNSFFGKSAGESNISGDRNSFFGKQSGALSTGADNSFYGASCALILSSGDGNSFFGAFSGENSDNVSECSSYGFFSLANNEQSKNSAFGAFSITANVSGSSLDAFGYSALFSNALGDGNSAFGQSSIFSNTDGDFNCGFGIESIYSNINANGISGFGYMTLRNSTENYNSSFGYKAGLSLTTGQFNSFFGASSAETGTISGLTGCTLLGASTTVSTGLTNATAIGYMASVTSSNSIILGSVGTKVGIGKTSSFFPLDVVGICQFKGTTSGFTGTGLIKSQSGFSTAGATSVTIDYPLSTSAPNILQSRIHISVINTVGDKSAYSTSNAAAFYNGITSASTGTLPTITMTTTAGYAPTASWSISGNNLRLTLTGVAASNEKWVVSYEYFSTFNTAA